MLQENMLPVTVTAIHKETLKVKRFELASLDGRPLPPYSGGSHIGIFIETEKGAIHRHYSLTGHTRKKGHYEIAVALNEDSKGGSTFMHHGVIEGDSLHISYPKNHFPLSFKAKRHVFYAAGIGITPFLSMMEELRGKNVPFILHYTARTKGTCPFYSFLKKTYPEQCRFYFSREPLVERLTTDTLAQHPIGTHVYFCGPGSFITEFTDAAAKLGYPSSSVHVERFTPPKPSVRNAFQVRLKNGSTVQVAEDQTLLEALLDHGIDTPYSCRSGRCGTCEIKVKKGEVDHCDSFLTEEEKGTNDTILVCVSRAKSRELVLEIE
ncbi:PDR/VanB family oxidoreductase [Fictibacillus sp. KIGAM418]|uniref:PDR/VanB family oxidoreductase n=1 Tax=Fictibacillus marinisediminis TaxID=2878389 RepID=A0A9X2BDY9_9BACL|nr:PDR/VanB family oxidoreductase [Fictibacillus marinisediminis]MCK6255567.1 PDR/VanB family oxidoreductase [Fictibacillus marinisediminis]